MVTGSEGRALWLVLTQPGSRLAARPSRAASVTQSPCQRDRGSLSPAEGQTQGTRECASLGLSSAPEGGVEWTSA